MYKARTPYFVNDSFKTKAEATRRNAQLRVRLLGPEDFSILQPWT